MFPFLLAFGRNLPIIGDFISSIEESFQQRRKKTTSTRQPSSSQITGNSWRRRRKSTDDNANEIGEWEEEEYNENQPHPSSFRKNPFQDPSHPNRNTQKPHFPQF